MVATPNANANGKEFITATYRHPSCLLRFDARVRLAIQEWVGYGG